ncbi:MAG: transcriptional regulator NrdR [Planctomycetota bacterium]
MKCPYCKKDNDRVVDSRSSEDGLAIRRRRECLECSRRYTSYERIDENPVKVIKKDGRRVPFDRTKLRAGMEKACEKRPVSAEQMDNIAEQIEAEALNKFEREIPTDFLGERVMAELRKIDQVAYVRFASVYREFKDVTEFVNVLNELNHVIRSGGGKGEQDQ